MLTILKMVTRSVTVEATGRETAVHPPVHEDGRQLRQELIGACRRRTKTPSMLS
jgi:hypothetical protein